ncbi:MAG: PD-(D/E)XK nuclease family protein [Sphingomonadales bacterium]
MDTDSAALLINCFDRTVNDARWRQAARREQAAPAFNIFELTRRSHFEVTTHSAFLASLLDPFGSHCQGTLFLEGLLRWLRLRCPTLVLPEAGIQWEVRAEYAFEIRDPDGENAGPSDQDPGSVTGQIDLLLRAEDGSSIVIENKVWAADQETQLYRYYKWQQSHASAANAKNQALIYLTVFGTEPSAASLGLLTKEEQQKIIRMSYRQDITEILGGCLDQIRAPEVGGVVRQYIETISGKHMSATPLEAKTDEFFSDARNLKIFSEMSRAFAGFQLRVFRSIASRLRERLDGPKNPWRLNAAERTPDAGYEGFGFLLDEQFHVMSGKLWVGYLWRNQGLPWLAIIRVDRSVPAEPWTAAFKQAVRPDISTHSESTASWIWYVRWPGWPSSGAVEDLLELVDSRGDKIVDAMEADLRRVLELVSGFSPPPDVAATPALL